MKVLENDKSEFTRCIKFVSKEPQRKDEDFQMESSRQIVPIQREITGAAMTLCCGTSSTPEIETFDDKDDELHRVEPRGLSYTYDFLLCVFHV